MSCVWIPLKVVYNSTYDQCNQAKSLKSKIMHFSFLAFSTSLRVYTTEIGQLVQKIQTVEGLQIKKQKKVSALFFCILNTELASSDAFRLITSPTCLFC